MTWFDMQEFSLWQDAWCRTCTTRWQDCTVLSEIYLCGGSESIGAGPGATPETSGYCTKYERDLKPPTDIEGVPV